MSIVLHPTAYTKWPGKGYSKLIPQDEYNTMKAAISFDTLVRCVDWHYKDRTAPLQHKIMARRSIDICRADSLMPVTCVPPWSVEPQMIGQHREFVEDNLYSISYPYHEPAIVSGETLVYLDTNHVASVNSLMKRGSTFEALRRRVGGSGIEQFRISKHSGSERCVRISVWEQPYRVKHTNGYLVLEMGLLVG